MELDEFGRTQYSYGYAAVDYLFTFSVHFVGVAFFPSPSTMHGFYLLPHFHLSTYFISFPSCLSLLIHHFSFLSPLFIIRSKHIEVIKIWRYPVRQLL